ncbi:MAG: DUF5615 family PIN-like protein [Bacillota bacterium]|nr:DUF5615 family PIN-like protein [Bacillota bacterium]
MPLSPGLARWLIEHGYNAVHALEIGLDRASDAVILERARKERRVVVTAGLDYPQLLSPDHPRPGSSISLLTCFLHV